MNTLNNNEKLNIMHLFMWLFGFFATMPLIQVFSMTVYIWFLFVFSMLLVGYFFTRRVLVNIKKVEKIYILINLFMLISIVYNMVVMPEKWQQGNISSILQLLCVFLFYVFFKTTNQLKWLVFFVKGIYSASVFQMIWGYLQLIFTFLGKDLNDLIFSEVLNMHEGGLTQTFGDTIKVSGLCWNSGNIAPLYLFGFVFSKNILLKILFAILSLISGSRTAMLGIIFCIFVQIVLKSREKKIITKKVIYYFLVIVCCSILGVIINFDIVNMYVDKVANMLLSLLSLRTEASGGIHLRYITSLIDVTKKNTMIHNLIGYGAGCSGYVFSKYYGQYTSIGQWVVECDYINCLWSYGYIGFLLYYTWYLKNIWISRKINKKYIILFSSLLFEGVFYNVTFNWVNLLIISIFILADKNIDIFENFEEIS